MSVQTVEEDVMRERRKAEKCVLHTWVCVCMIERVSERERLGKTKAIADIG